MSKIPPQLGAVSDASKSSLKESLKAALPYLPRHRSRTKRSRVLHLDELLDDGRATRGLSAGALDFVLMGYRFWFHFRERLSAFSSKALSPPVLEDLLLAIDAALLTRDQTPVPVLVSEGVEVARELFGERTTAVTNAFLRQAVRDLDARKAALKAHPESLLGPQLHTRWATSAPELARFTGEALRIRPAPGIPSFDGDAHFELRDSKTFLEAAQDSTKFIQAMDPGSWRFVEALVATLSEAHRKSPSREPLICLDACAAPGGKTLAWRALARKTGLPLKSYATDSDFRRLERLRQNLRRWKCSDEIPTTTFAWGSGEEALPESWPTHFDVVLADLPCSGTGTFARRPDLLLEDVGERVATLAHTQMGIIEALRKRVRPGGWMIVSLCSVDPEEVAHIGRLCGSGGQGRPPDFMSWKTENVDPLSEGITAWIFRVE